MSASIIDHRALDQDLTGLRSAAHWYVGFSGGVDSSALLHLLVLWRRANPGAPELTAIHINHGMQSVADEWQVHCEWVCKMLQVPLLARRVAVDPGGQGSEAAAREARYAAFEQQLQAGEVLFLGHHLDDQVETFFLRLLRGAGVHGLAAIPRRRKLGEGQLVRPLLSLTREQLLDYASGHGLSCIEDPSNTNVAMDRNFLRAEMLPLLASRWPGYRRTVTRASEHMAVTASTLDDLLPAPDTVYSALGDPGVGVAALVGKSAAAQLRGWLQARGLPPPDQSALEEFLRQLRESTDDSSPRLQCSAYTLQRYRGVVYLLPEPGEESQGSLQLSPGGVQEVSGVGRVSLQPAAEAGLLLAAQERLTLAWRSGGERCTPVGRGGSTSLKKLLQELDVPPWWRDRVPLLYLDDELLSVGDLCLCRSGRLQSSVGDGETLWRLVWQRSSQVSGD